MGFEFRYQVAAQEQGFSKNDTDEELEDVDEDDDREEKQDGDDDGGSPVIAYV